MLPDGLATTLGTTPRVPPKTFFSLTFGEKGTAVTLHNTPIETLEEFDRLIETLSSARALWGKKT